MRYSGAVVCTFATANAVHNIQCSALHFCELMQCIISFFGASPTPGGPTCPNMSPSAVASLPADDYGGGDDYGDGDGGGDGDD